MFCAAKFAVVNNLSGFEVYMNGAVYGHYPVDANHSFKMSLEFALNDVKDYGFSGIIFES